MTISIATATRNAMLNAITTAAGASALLRIYDGTRATDANTAVGAQTKLAELVCNATFAPAASGGVLTLNAIANATALASSTATWFRLTVAGGATTILDGSISTSGSDMNLNSVAISSGATVSISSATLTAGNP